jgi:hypothetical protein
VNECQFVWANDCVFVNGSKKPYGDAVDGARGKHRGERLGVFDLFSLILFYECVV